MRRARPSASEGQLSAREPSRRRTGEYANAARRRSRALSSLRPLAWRFWAPLAAAGLVAGQVLEFAAPGIARRLLIAALLAWPALRSRHRAAGTGAALLLVAAAFGVARGQALRWIAAGADLPSGNVIVDGIVTAAVSRPPRGARLDVLLDRTAPVLVPGAGRVARLYVGETTREWRAGDGIEARAELRPPRGFCNLGSDPTAREMARLGVVAIARLKDDRRASRREGRTLAASWVRALEGARAAVGDAIDAVVAPPESAVLRALLIGDQRRIPADLRDAYRATGTAHVLSVSGLHIAIVAGCVYRIAGWLLARWAWLAERVPAPRAATVAALAAALAYAAIVGPGVATVRSLVMAAVFLGGVALARRAAIETAIAWAVLVVCVLDPGAWADVSFQLSFGAVVAIVVGMRWIARALPGTAEGRRGASSWTRRGVATVVDGACVSLCAALGTAPMTAFHFGSVSLVGVAANLAVVPLVGWAALLAGLVGGVVAVLSSQLAEVFLTLAAWSIHCADRVVLWAAALPGAAIPVRHPSPSQAVDLFAALLALALPRGARRSGLLWAAAAALAAEVACGALAPLLRSELLRVAFLDVGQGDAAVVELPSGGVLVFDGGGLGAGFDTGERVVAPFLRARGIASVDALAMSHPERDHIGGLAWVVREFAVGEFWSTGARSSSQTFAELDGVLASRALPRRTLVPGLARPSGARPFEVEVLHPPPAAVRLSENDRSLVLALRFGASRLLLTGDIESPAERQILASGRDVAATIQKVAHHGSRTSSSARWVDSVRPGVASAMLGDANRFGFPAPEVRQRYLERGAAWLETDRAGEVDIESDGQLERVRTCRSLG